MNARVDSSEEKATRTPVHEPPVHESWAHEPRVDWPSAHKTPEKNTSGWGTWPDQPEGPSGHADDGGKPTDIERGHRLPAWLYTAPVRAGDPRTEVVDFP